MWTKKDENLIAECEKIKKRILRHVDGVEHMVVTWDAVHECSLCYRPWEIDDAGCPVCCDKAIAEWEAEQ